MRNRSLLLLCSLALACSNSGPVLSLETPEFTVGPHRERYLCYATTLKEELSIDRFDYPVSPLVHHLLLARTLQPEPEGFSECDVLFRSTWVPMFGAGASSSSLQLPEDTAYTLPEGTQLLLQLHLHNATHAEATSRARVELRRSTHPKPVPAGLYAFGTANIELPPAQTTPVTSDCTPKEPVELFAVLPHMHYLGRRMQLEVGSSEQTLQEVYRRDPYHFDDQYAEPLSLSLGAGMLTRVTCTYENPGSGTVGFGESSSDEMCFLVGFARNRRGLGGCINGLTWEDPRDPAAGACGEQQPNALGIGAPCTKGGNECAPGLTCSLDQASTPEGSKGFCLKIGGCGSAEDCGGGGATCCAPAQGGGLVTICMPEACRPTNCKRR